MKIRNIVSSFAILFVLIILIVNFWGGAGGFQESYDIEEGNLEDGKNVFEKLSELNLINGLNNLMQGIQQLGKIQNPFDLLGGLAVGAAGTLQVIGGIVTFPIEIFGVLAGFYDNVIPPVISQLVGFIGVIAVGFILLSAKLGFEL